MYYIGIFLCKKNSEFKNEVYLTMVYRLFNNCWVLLTKILFRINNNIVLLITPALQSFPNQNISSVEKEVILF